MSGHIYVLDRSAFVSFVAACSANGTVLKILTLPANHCFETIVLRLNSLKKNLLL